MQGEMEIGTEQIWRCVSQWLTVRECVNLRKTAHCMDFLAQEDMFSEMAVRIIAPVQLRNAPEGTGEQACAAWVQLCKQLLDIPSIKVLVQCFHRFTAPIVGYWRKREQEPGEYRGELLRIRPSHDFSLIAERLAPNGAVELRFTLRVTFNFVTQVPKLLAEGPVTALSVTQQADDLVISSTLSSSSYTAIPVGIPRGLAFAEPQLSWIGGLPNFAVAQYAGHGLEILFLQVSTPSTEPYWHPHCQIGHPRLDGLKVVGDANVPAGQFSFMIDLCATHDPDERLASDTRLVVAFPAEGAQIVSVDHRRDKIQHWFRGKGQTNRVPGVWQPEWQDLNFIVYREDSREQLGGTLFSLLWEDRDQPFRHVIDFKRFGDDIEPVWMLPPTVDVEEVMNAEDSLAAV